MINPNQPEQPEKPMTHRQAKSMAVATRIYAEWKWNLRKSDLTWPSVVLLIDAAIKLCGDEIPDETIRRECIKRFKDVRVKVIAMAEAEVDAPANIAKLTGEACVRCGKDIAVDEPKTWVADGQYVCGGCQP